MANLFHPKDRHTIPNWRKFNDTVVSGELNDCQPTQASPRATLSIDEYIFSWQANKTISMAADLISAAYVNGFTDNSVVKEASEFVLRNKTKGTPLLLDFANQIVLRQEPAANLGHQTPPQEKGHVGLPDINIDIRERKARLKKFPSNPIPYVELSRLYSIKGEREKAIQNMHIALSLFPENRFILRAAARLFAHYDQADFIHAIIKKSAIVRHDPWIVSTEIALAAILEQTSKNIRIGREMIQSQNYPPNCLSELSSALGTLEFLNGNNDKTRKFLRTALKSPNDNSLAQIEWILNHTPLFETNLEKYQIANKFEALALNNYRNKRWDQTLENAIDWFWDLPFSKQPVMLASHVAGSILGKSEKARDLLIAGLQSHPNDPQIINNLAYSFAVDNKLAEAETYISKIKNFSELDKTTQICLTATRGLIAFRRRQLDEGRYLYKKALDGIENNKYLKSLAFLNYFREELLAGSQHIKPLGEQLSAIPDDLNRPDLDVLRNTVLELYKSRKEH